MTISWDVLLEPVQESKIQWCASVLNDFIDALNKVIKSKKDSRLAIQPLQQSFESSQKLQEAQQLQQLHEVLHLEEHLYLAEFQLLREHWTLREQTPYQQHDDFSKAKEHELARKRQHLKLHQKHWHDESRQLYARYLQLRKRRKLQQSEEFQQPGEFQQHGEFQQAGESQQLRKRFEQLSEQEPLLDTYAPRLGLEIPCDQEDIMSSSNLPLIVSLLPLIMFLVIFAPGFLRVCWNCLHWVLRKIVAGLCKLRK